MKEEREVSRHKRIIMRIRIRIRVTKNALPWVLIFSKISKSASIFLK